MSPAAAPDDGVPAHAAVRAAPPLNPRDRFLTLDFLRGIAAVCVLFFHWFEAQRYPWFAYGYLAVDFFFLLSGFVLAHAYESSLTRTVSTRTFLRNRLIRLYPLIVAGTMLGLLRQVLHAQATETLGPWTGYLESTLAELLLIPDVLNTQGDRALYTINGVVWSLFFELMANVAYALCFRWLRSNRVLAGVVVVSGSALVVSACVMGGNVGLGWSAPTFIYGFPRVFFSFFAGVALFRLRESRHLDALAAGPVLLSLTLFAVMVQPAGNIPVAEQLGLVLFVFPVILLLGAGYSPRGRWKSASNVLAELSYPLYVLHAPLLWLFTGSLKFSRYYGQISIFASGAVVLVLVCAVSWLALRYYDRPARRWMSALFPGAGKPPPGWPRQPGMLDGSAGRRP